MRLLPFFGLPLLLGLEGRPELELSPEESEAIRLALAGPRSEDAPAA